MAAHAVTIRRNNGTLGLLLRVVRSPSGIYIVFGAGQHRPGHDPHSSWHRDGRVHHKSFKREFHRVRRQALAMFVGADYFLTTSVNFDAAAFLPDCKLEDFESVIEVPTRDGSTRTQLDVGLFAASASPLPPAIPHVNIWRSVIADGEPQIAVTVYDAVI